MTKIKYKGTRTDKRGNSVAVFTGTFREVVAWMEEYQGEEGELYFGVAPTVEWE